MVLAYWPCGTTGTKRVQARAVLGRLPRPHRRAQVVAAYHLVQTALRARAWPAWVTAGAALAAGLGLAGSGLSWCVLGDLRLQRASALRQGAPPMSSYVTLQAKSLKHLGQLAIEQVGECVGIRWWPTRAYRGAAVYFRYLDAARAFARIARRRGFIVCNPAGAYERLNERGELSVHPNEPIAFRGFPVLALVQADAHQSQGWRRAPAFCDQPATRTWGVITERERQQQATHRLQREADAPLEHWRDEEVERDLDAITAEVNAWWQASGREQAEPRGVSCCEGTAAGSQPGCQAHRRRWPCNQPWATEGRRRGRRAGGAGTGKGQRAAPTPAAAHPRRRR